MSPLATVPSAPEPHQPPWCTNNHARADAMSGHHAHVGHLQVKPGCSISVGLFQKGADHLAEVVVNYVDLYDDGRIPVLFLTPASAVGLAVMQEALGHTELAGLLREAAKVIEGEVSS